MPTQSIEWDAIVRKIRKGKSILILGPGVYRHKNGATLQSVFIDELDLSNNHYIQNYYREDEFFLFADEGRGFTIDRMESFYEQQQPGELLGKIARLPFQVILNVTPDHLLRRAFDLEGFRYQFDHYKKIHEPIAIQQPTQELPLLYNLLGSVEDEESLLMTHNDLYDYFKAIFSRKSMPDKLKIALKHKKINCFIFLGVPFEKWYMQLLLRELGIHRDRENFIRYAANVDLTDEIQTFCTEQFTIQFVENGSTQFVNELFERFERHGYLRPRGKETRWERLRKLIGDDRLEEALRLLIEYTKGTELENKSIALRRRYSKLVRRKINTQPDSINIRDINAEEDRITEEALDLINYAETIL